MESVIENYRNDVTATFENYRKLAERALEQMSDEEFFSFTGTEDNSAAVIVKHIAGNLRSRFTDFLTTDGEKPDRHRDNEFFVDDESRKALMDDWNKGWVILDNAIRPLKASDFEGEVTIRGETHTIVEALNRQLAHYAYHIGQIVFLAKHCRSSEWKTLSVPRNKSDEFNRFLNAKKGNRKSHPIEGALDFADTNIKGE